MRPGGGWGRWGTTRTLSVLTSRSAIPTSVTTFRIRCMATVLSASAAVAVRAWVTTPALNSAVSGRAETVAVPVTVMEGAGSWARPQP